MCDFYCEYLKYSEYWNSYKRYLKICVTLIKRNILHHIVIKNVNFGFEVF